jgi:hypothetical protein
MNDSERESPATEPGGSSAESLWPSIPVAEWSGTRDTLQLWTQIVGKIRMVNAPLVNHWWNVTLYVSARGLTTGLIPHASGQGFQIDFDFRAHELEVITTRGAKRSIALERGPVSKFFTRTMAVLAEAGVPTKIWPMPVEIEMAIPFPDDEVHVEYRPEQAERFWLALVQIERVFTEFRSRFLGKASPVHLFWGALDLATTRFSGRPAPPYPREVPNCGPHVMLEAYSHEVSSCGYWPGGDGEGLFYSYAYPEPAGFREASVRPASAAFDEQLSEFVLPYSVVRTAPEPDLVLLGFLQSTYEAAANAAAWDRAALERHRD